MRGLSRHRVVCLLVSLWGSGACSSDNSSGGTNGPPTEGSDVQTTDSVGVGDTDELADSEGSEVDSSRRDAGDGSSGDAGDGSSGDAGDGSGAVADGSSVEVDGSGADADGGPSDEDGSASDEDGSGADAASDAADADADEPDGVPDTAEEDGGDGTDDDVSDAVEPSDGTDEETTTDVADGDTEVEDAAPEDAGDIADAAGDVEADAGEPVAIGLCPAVVRTALPATGPGTAPGAVSPVATGFSSNVVLGRRTRTTPSANPVASGAVATGLDLQTLTYDVYVPPAYTGDTPYGLIVFINSGDDGGAPNSTYLPLMASERLIHIAPDGAGNSVNVDIRMGRAVLGALRAMEVFNIDPRRVYAMGNSGGARSAHMVLYQYPDLFTGGMPRCGASYPREVTQEFETQEPDSNYEFAGSFYFPNVGGLPYLEALRQRRHRFALMTTFDDFREGDVFNVYHHGMEEDGLISRLVQGSGGHCATDAAHFYDALGFVEHPWLEVYSDEFGDGVPSTRPGGLAGVVPVSGSVSESGGVLRLSPDGAPAVTLIPQRAHWSDRHGVVVRAQPNLAGAPSGWFELGIWPYEQAVHTDALALTPTSLLAESSAPRLGLRLIRAGATDRVEVVVQRPGQAVQTIFRGDVVAGTTVGGGYDVKLEAWDAELQIDLGRPLATPAVIATGVRLLDDRRTIRVRWSALSPAGWPAGVWSSDVGSVLTVAAGGEATDVVTVDNLSVVDGWGFTCADGAAAGD